MSVKTRLTDVLASGPEPRRHGENCFKNRHVVLNQARGHCKLMHFSVPMWIL